MGLDMEIRYNGEEVIYMRKQNAIRRWFAENLDNFNDNDLTSVPKNKFEELIATMEELVEEGGIKDMYDNYVKCCEYGEEQCVMDAILLSFKTFVEEGGKRYENFVQKAEEFFPTQSGFFFGSTDYDEWYIEQVISYLYRFKLLYNEIVNSTEEWLDDTIEYWEWY